MIYTPDPGQPTRTTATVDGGPTLLNQITANPTLWAAAAAAVFLLLAVALIALAVRHRRQPSRTGALDKALTFFAAAVATGVVGTGMWAFFRDTLHVDNPWLRGLLFAFFELAMLAEALRSRSFRLARAAREEVNPPKPGEPRPFDIDGLAVLVLAFLSGALAATHEPTWGGKGLRVAAPLVAAWLWERGLAGELRQFTRRPSGRPNPIKTAWERTLVAAGLADPTDRTVSERAAARILDRLARARWRVHTLEAAGANRVSVGYARWVLRRRFLAAFNRLDLAGNPALRQDLQRRVAVLAGGEAGIDPVAVTHLQVWAPPTVTPATDTSGVTGDAEPAATPAVTPPAAHPQIGATPGRPTTVRRTVTRAPRPRAGSATPATAFSHLRHLVDQARQDMTDEQVWEFAAQRAQAVLDSNGTKVAAMREYFLTCVVMDAPVVGSRMGQAVDGSEGKARELAKKWQGELAEEEAEHVFAAALDRIVTERQGGGDADA